MSPLLQLPGGRASATLLAGDVRLVVIFFQDELVSDAYHSSCHGSCTWRQEGNNPKITTDICSQAETTLPCHTVAKPQKKLSTGAVKGNGVSWGCKARMQMGGTRGRQLELAGFGEGRGARLKHRGANHSQFTAPGRARCYAACQRVPTPRLQKAKAARTYFWLFISSFSSGDAAACWLCAAGTRGAGQGQDLSLQTAAPVLTGGKGLRAAPTPGDPRLLREGGREDSGQRG